MLVKLGLKSSSLSLFEAEAKKNEFYYVRRFSTEKHLKPWKNADLIEALRLKEGELQRQMQEGLELK
jgi:hypothetical protein